MGEGKPGALVVHNRGLDCKPSTKNWRVDSRVGISVEDVQSSMVAAFGSGAMFTLVSGMGGPNLAANVVSSGVLFALMQGGLFKVT